MADNEIEINSRTFSKEITVVVNVKVKRDIFTKIGMLLIGIGSWMCGMKYEEIEESEA